MDDYYDRLGRQLAELTCNGAHLPTRRLPRPGIGRLTAAVSSAVAVAVAVVILASVHHGSAPRAASGHAASPEPLRPRGPHAAAKLLTQLNLSPPPGVHDRLRAGVAQVIASGGTTGIVIVARRLPPNARNNAYAVWLAGGPRPRPDRLLGFIATRVGRSGKLQTEGVLPGGADRYHRLLITVQRSARPTRPGPIILEGPFPGATAPAHRRTSRARRVNPLGS
jgi:hypothetical protein